MNNKYQNEFPEDFFRQLVETENNLIVQFDAEGHLLYANPIYLQTFGVTEEEIIGKKFLSLIQEEDQNTIKDSLSRALSAPYASKHRERAETTDGWRWFVWHATGIPNEKGQVDSIISIGHDITDQVNAENKLQESEERFRKLFETSPLGILTVNSIGIFTSCNPALLKHLGFETEEIIGQDFRKIPILSNDTIAYIEKIFTELLEGVKAEDIIIEWVDRSGETKYGLANFSLIKKNNKVEEIQVILEDITERAKNEERLKREQTKAQQYLDIAEVIILALDSNQCITLANRKCYKMLGYETEEEILGKNWLENFIPKQEKDFVNSTLKTILSGDINQVEYIENSIRTKSGETRTIAWRNTLLTNDAGEVIGSLSSGQDITDQKDAELALRNSILTSDYIVRTIPVGIFIYQYEPPDKLYLIDNNPESETITGMEVKNLRGKEFNQIWPKAKAAGITDEYLEVMRTGVTLERENPVYEDDKLEGIFRVKAFKIPEDRLVVAFENITEMKKAEEAIRNMNKVLEQRVAQRTAQLREANKELEAFSYSVSHDLQAPVRAIQGFSQIIELDYGEKLPEDVLEFLGRIQNATQKMHQLIDGLLDLSRLGQKKLLLEKIDLPPLAEKIFEEMAQTETKRQIDFKIATDKTITGDREMISILLRNLIGNAIKYTRKREVSTIEFGCKSIEGTETFYVTDNGIGFNMEFANKLFNPFQRLHSDEDFEGSGIGLSLARRIILHHNGNIWVTSEKNKGSTFYFTIGRLDPNPLSFEI